MHLEGFWKMNCPGAEPAQPRTATHSHEQPRAATHVCVSRIHSLAALGRQSPSSQAPVTCSRASQQLSARSPPDALRTPQAKPQGCHCLHTLHSMGEIHRFHSHQNPNCGKSQKPGCHLAGGKPQDRPAGCFFTNSDRDESQSLFQLTKLPLATPLSALRVSFM